MDPADRTEELAPSRLREFFAIVVALVVGVHLVLVTLSALPPNAASASAQPASTYLSPFFTQNWRLFAPNPVSADHTVRFQGAYLDGDEVVTTSWVDWTDVELGLVRHKLVGGRAGYVTNKMYSALYTRFAALDEAQQGAVVADDPLEPATWEGLRDGVAGPSVDAAQRGSGEAWLRYERAVNELGTAVLTARHPEREWVSVRFSVRSQRVPPYEQRHGTDEEREASRPTAYERMSGWRVPLPPGPGALEAVADFDRRHR